MVDLHRQQARLAAATARLTTALEARRAWADDGSRSCGAWVAHHCRLPAAQARAGLWLGRRLRTMPVTAEAFAAGDMSQRHASLLAALAGGRTAECFARDEVMLVGYARTMAWPEFCRAVEYWRQCADPDGTERDAAHDEALRRVHLVPGPPRHRPSRWAVDTAGPGHCGVGVGPHRTGAVRCRLGVRPGRARRRRHRLPPHPYAGAAPPRRPRGDGAAGRDRACRGQAAPTTRQRAGWLRDLQGPGV